MAKEFKIRAKIVLDSTNKLKDTFEKTFSTKGIVSDLSKGLSAFGQVGNSVATTIGAGIKAVSSVSAGAAGMGTGATIGSVAPGVGTAIGAAVGVVIGSVIKPGLDAIVGQLKSASPLLGQVFDLISNMSNMVLKPFADAFALVLLPIVLWMYKYLIIPFYQYVYPAMMKLVDFIKPIVPFLEQMVMVVLGMVATLAIIGAILLSPLLLIVAGIIAGIALIALIGTGIEWVAKEVIAIAPAVGRFIVDLGITIGNAIVGAYRVIVSTLHRYLGYVISGVTGLVSAVWEVMGPYIMPIVETLQSAVSTITEWLGNVISAITDMVLSIGTAIGAIIDTAITTIGSLFALAISPLKAVLDIMVSAMGIVKQKIIDIKDFLIGIVQPFIDGMKTVFASLSDAVGDVADTTSDIPFVGGSRSTKTNNYSLYIQQMIQDSTDPATTAEKVSQRLAEQMEGIV